MRKLILVSILMLWLSPTYAQQAEAECKTTFGYKSCQIRQDGTIRKKKYYIEEDGSEVLYSESLKRRPNRGAGQSIDWVILDMPLREFLEQANGQQFNCVEHTELNLRTCTKEIQNQCGADGFLKQFYKVYIRRTRVNRIIMYQDCWHGGLDSSPDIEKQILQKHQVTDEFKHYR